MDKDPYESNNNRIHDSKNTCKDLKLSSVLTTFSQTEVIIILVAPIHPFPTPHDALRELWV